MIRFIKYIRIYSIYLVFTLFVSILFNSNIQRVYGAQNQLKFKTEGIGVSSVIQVDTKNTNEAITYSLQKQKQLPIKDVYYENSNGKWVYEETEFERFIRNVFHYSYPNVSKDKLSEIYNDNRYMTNTDTYTLTQKLIWLGESIEKSGSGFDLQSILNESVSFGLDKDKIAIGILLNALKDFENNIYSYNEDTSTVNIEEGNGFSVENIWVNAVRIGPYKISNGSESLGSQLKLNITVNDTNSKIVNENGKNITTASENDKIYIITKSEEVAKNLSLKIEGKVGEKLGYKMLIPSDENFAQLLICTTEPVNISKSKVVSYENKLEGNIVNNKMIVSNFKKQLGNIISISFNEYKDSLSNLEVAKLVHSSKNDELDNLDKLGAAEEAQKDHKNDTISFIGKVYEFGKYKTKAELRKLKYIHNYNIRGQPLETKLKSSIKCCNLYITNEEFG